MKCPDLFFVSRIQGAAVLQLLKEAAQPLDLSWPLGLATPPLKFDLNTPRQLAIFERRYGPYMFQPSFSVYIYYVKFSGV